MHTVILGVRIGLAVHEPNSFRIKRDFMDIWNTPFDIFTRSCNVVAGNEIFKQHYFGKTKSTA